MMKFNRKWAAGVGIALSIGGVFWMREVVSWRPVVVARLDMMPYQMQLSSDGNYLRVDGASNLLVRVGQARIRQGQSAVINLQAASIETSRIYGQDFGKNHRRAVFPRVRSDFFKKQLFFSPAPGKTVRLATQGVSERVFSSFERDDPFAYSRQRGEVLREAVGVIYTWNWSNGRLKKKVRYRPLNPFQTVTFSPDARWLLAFTQSPQGRNSLDRYEVATGKLSDVVDEGAGIAAFGFSPDSRYLWFVRQPKARFDSFHAVPNTAKIQPNAGWSAPCAGTSKWLSDGRIGLVQRDGFSWRDSSGREIGHLLGPLPNDTQWEAIPDGNWIYSCKNDGTIRRWRAR